MDENDSLQICRNPVWVLGQFNLPVGLSELFIGGLQPGRAAITMKMNTIEEKELEFFTM